VKILKNTAIVPQQRFLRVGDDPPTGGRDLLY